MTHIRFLKKCFVFVKCLFFVSFFGNPAGFHLGGGGGGIFSGVLNRLGRPVMLL